MQLRLFPEPTRGGVPQNALLRTGNSLCRKRPKILASPTDRHANPPRRSSERPGIVQAAVFCQVSAGTVSEIPWRAAANRAETGGDATAWGRRA